jgi:hypothetical protein
MIKFSLEQNRITVGKQLPQNERGDSIWPYHHALETSTICSILQIICKAHLTKNHSAGTFEQNNTNVYDF